MQRLHRFVITLVAVAVMLAALPQRSDADVFVGGGVSAGLSLNLGVSVDFAPPALPVYVQPPAPYVNAIWQPGYWAWGPYGYYWVPGTWVRPPQFGYLWTPGYWGFAGGLYAWHPGYWGQHIGFYGGINYGYGYFGRGFVGGAWFGNVFRYNTAVVNVNTTVIRNTYVDRTVIVNNYNTNLTRVSYNGGYGGVHAVATDQERAYSTESHLAMTSEQRTNVQLARQNRNYLASVNGGRPQDAAASAPLSHENLPPSFNRVTPQDRTNASAMSAHVQRPQALERPQMQNHAQAQYHPQAQYHTQPQSHAQPQSRPQTREAVARPARQAAAHPRPTGRPR